MVTKLSRPYKMIHRLGNAKYPGQPVAEGRREKFHKRGDLLIRYYFFTLGV